MRRLLPSLLLPLVLVLVACGGSDDSGGGGSTTGGGGGGGGGGPTLTLSGDSTSTDPDESVSVSVSDSSGTLSTTWVLLDGPSEVVAFDNPNSLSPTVTFPLNGVYRLQVTVSDDSGSSSASVTVTVADAQAFALEGSVTDAGSPTGGVGIRLEWQHGGATLVPLQTSTSGSGSYRIEGLIGSLDAFAVRVSGS